MNVIIVEREEIDAAGTATVSGARARHLTNVLRVAPGHAIRVGLLDGPMGAGIVTGIDGDVVRVQCALDAPVADVPAVDLLLALPRPKVLRRLWAQLAALGVGRIMLTNAERVERPYFDTHVLDPTTYRPLLVEGLQQARDTRLPVVSVHRQFRVLVEDQLDQWCPSGRRIVADPAGGASVSDALSSATGRVLLAIGPEGGWNRFELDLLARHGFVAVAMGPRTLRSDTATVALLALVHDALRR